MKDVDEFIGELPRTEQLLTRRLRGIILETDPRIREKLSYGVPYFMKNRRLCFIWPQSVPYGPKDALVSLGFCYGHMLSNNQGVLLHEGRTQVYIIKYNALTEIEETTIGEILQEALMVDELDFKKTKK